MDSVLELMESGQAVGGMVSTTTGKGLPHSKPLTAQHLQV